MVNVTINMKHAGGHKIIHLETLTCFKHFQTTVTLPNQPTTLLGKDWLGDLQEPVTKKWDFMWFCLFKKKAGWWFEPTPLKKMKVSWDDDIPNIWNINLPKIYTQMLHVSYIYIQNWVIYAVNKCW